MKGTFCPAAALFSLSLEINIHNVQICFKYLWCWTYCRRNIFKIIQKISGENKRLPSDSHPGTVLSKRGSMKQKLERTFPYDNKLLIFTKKTKFKSVKLWFWFFFKLL